MLTSSFKVHFKSIKITWPFVADVHTSIGQVQFSMNMNSHIVIHFCTRYTPTSYSKYQKTESRWPLIRFNHHFSSGWYLIQHLLILIVSPMTKSKNAINIGIAISQQQAVTASTIYTKPYIIKGRRPGCFIPSMQIPYVRNSVDHMSIMLYLISWFSNCMKKNTVSLVSCEMLTYFK